ncbi:MAG: DUF3379 family protein [Usitatibacter sp.]
MNCIDFRRLVLANPRQPGAMERAHAEECAACRQYLEKQREFDAELFGALQVPPPDGLADRILVARGLRTRRWVMPMAAALVMTVGVAMVWPRLSAGDPLGREAIAHVAHEPQAFTTSHAVPGNFLPAVMAEQGVSVAKAIGQVTYATVCPLAGKVARHLVVRTAAGPVTLFLFAEDPNPRTRTVTERDGMTAITIPAAKGSITLVAASIEAAMAIEKSLRKV